MATKYILNSGGIRHSSEKAREFFHEVLKGFGENPQLLICAFAQPRECWETKFAEDEAMFRNMFEKNAQPLLDLAFPDTFEEQLRQSSVIYIHGGDDHLIQYWLRKFDLPKLWEGKTVATNSAGSHAMAQHFWTCDWRRCMDGLGILPIKFLAHFQSEYGKHDLRGPINWEDAYSQLQEFGDKNLPIYALKEGEFEVFRS